MNDHLPTLVLLLAACTSSANPPSTASTRASNEAGESAPESEPANAPVGSAPVEAAAIPRAQAIELAADFVRAQGYLDTPPLPSATLVPESLESNVRDQVIRGRANTLEPHPVGAYSEGPGWLVVFAYRTPTRPGFGRALRLGADRSMQMVHQDIRLPAPLEPLTLVARLRSMPENTPRCGDEHVAVVAEYEVIQRVEGSFEGNRVMVIHACPELPRARYDEGAGDASAFVVGNAYRLRLVPNVPDESPAIVDAGAYAELHRYWAERTDAANAP